MRFPPHLVREWIKPQARVLDLGCGDGTLLQQLADERDILGYGLEIDPDNIQACMKAGVNILEQDLDKGLGNFDDDSFDTVIMTQTLQAVHFPDRLLLDTLRVGKEAIVSFPNFGHWRCRAHLAVRGRMPVSNFLPYRWYNTPNIHFCTVVDFEQLCQHQGIKILNREFVDTQNRAPAMARFWPNAFAVTAIYRISGQDS
jgi:methionine biosynthesis protein MetW